MRKVWIGVLGVSAALLAIAIEVGDRDWILTAVTVAAAIFLLTLAIAFHRRDQTPNLDIEQLQAEVRSLSDRLKKIEGIIAQWSRESLQDAPIDDISTKERYNET